MDRVTIGRNLRLRRHDLGLSQTEVAKQLGLYRKTLGKIETGRASLPMESAAIAVQILQFDSLETLLIPPWQQKPLASSQPPQSSAHS